MASDCTQDTVQTFSLACNALSVSLPVTSHLFLPHILWFYHRLLCALAYTPFSHFPYLLTLLTI